MELASQEEDWLKTDNEITPTPIPGPTQIIQPTIIPTPTGDILNEGINIERNPTPYSEIGTVETEVVETYQCLQNSLNGCVITDKEDYSPNEVVLISGHGFIPNTPYVLVIASETGQLAEQFGILTNKEGSFEYSYQLDGTYRPNYSVFVYDSNNNLVTETSFTDSPPSECISDTDWADDEPGQKDLTEMCTDYSEWSAFLEVSWNWDDIAWSGNNTGDACSLFDNDNDGYANYAVCVQVTDEPAVFDSQYLYTCNDTSAVRCFDSTLKTPSANTICVASVQSGTNPFDLGSDTVADCKINTLDVGGSPTILLDVCSYPSAQPNSDPSDCIVASTANQTGFLEVKKVIDPSTDSGLFNLQIDGTTYKYDAGNNGSTGEKIVDAGNHIIRETAGTATTLTDYTSSIECKDANGSGSIVAQITGPGPLTVPVENNDDIVCTITNTYQGGSVTIIKDRVPDYPESFQFTGDLGSFDLSGDSTAVDYQKTFTNLTPQTYVVTELEPSETYLDSISCTGDTDNGTVVNLDNNSVNIDLDQNEDIVCTFTNKERGSISGTKWEDMNGNGIRDAEDLPISGWTVKLDKDADGVIDQTTTTDGNGDYTFNNLLPGTYKVLEESPYPWNVSYPSSGINYYNGIVLTTGDSLTGYNFGNYKNGEIKGYKWEDINGDGNKDNGEGAPDNQWQIKLWKEIDGIPVDQGSSVYSNPTTGAFTFGVTPGTYYLSEVMQEGWLQTYPTNAVLAPDGVTRLLGPIVITSGSISENNNFGNVQQGSISGYKYEDMDGDLSTTEDLSSIFGWTIDLYECIDDFDNCLIKETTQTDNDGYYIFENLLPGLYKIIEALPGGWTNILPITINGELTAGEVSTENNFINFENVSITACKVEDNDGLVNTTEDQTFVNGWEVTLTKNDISDTQLTETDGCYTWSNLEPGDYALSEEARNGWTNLNSSTHSFGIVESGQSYSYTFVNSRLGEIIVEKQVLPDGYYQTFAFNGEVSGMIGDGQQLSKTVLPGTYTVSESMPYTSGYQLKNIVCDDDNSVSNIQAGTATYIVEPGETVKCTFTNEMFGSITAKKFHDYNQDETQNAGEPSLPNWQMSFYDGFGCEEENNTWSSTTGTDGTVTMYSLLPGEYSVKERLVEGWMNTTDLCQNIIVAPGENTSVDFGNLQLGSLIVHKFEDIDGDGVKQASEPYVENWRMTLHNGNSCTNQNQIDEGFTNENGEYEFSNLTPGIYSVFEWPQNGWTNSTGNPCKTVTLTANQNTTVEFGNYKTGFIEGRKFEDLNSSGSYNTGEPFLPGWTIRLYNDKDGSWQDNDIESITDGSGWYRFSDLSMGRYKICEVMQSGWTQTVPTGTVNNEESNEAPRCRVVTVDESGEVLRRNFGNVQYGSVRVHKFEDLNNNSIFNDDEPLLDNWVIQLGNETKTTVNGIAEFNNLIPGNYGLTELTYLTDWQLTNIYCDNVDFAIDSSNQYNVTVASGENVNCYVGNYQLGLIQGRKYYDYNQNGSKDSDDTWLKGWVIRLYKDVRGIWQDISETRTTSNNGLFRFENLEPGTYYTCEVLQEGWQQTGPVLGGQRIVNQSPNSNIDEAPVCWQSVINQSGTRRTGRRFGNVQYGNILVTKYNDLNNNGQRDPEELVLPDWEITLKKVQDSDYAESSLTDIEGSVQFNNLLEAEYYLSETMKEGWQQTDITCYLEEQESVTEDVQVDLVDPYDSENGQYLLNLNPGETYNCEIGNHYAPPILTIAKSNNVWPTTTTPGNSVEYKIVLDVEDNNIKNVKVTDLPPEGFTYRGGSYKVLLTRGGTTTDITSQVNEPVYHSPGVWGLGDLEKDDQVTMIYTADIQGSTDFGLYKDLAFAYGCPIGQEQCSVTDEEAVVASSVDSGTADDGVVNENFVGTKVNINQETTETNTFSVEKEEEKKEEGSVLGASTGLPATGSVTLITQIALVSMLGSLLLLAINLLRKKKAHIVSLLVLTAIFFNITQVNAAEITSVRLEEPKSPTNENSFNLEFVAMDMANSQIQVECYKKGPTDSTYTKFDTTKNLKAGGNSGQCVVNSSVMPENGSYGFYVIATGSMQVSSEYVIVDYNSSRPSTPVSYSKDKIDSCHYKIKFKTADDGDRTNGVEIYRSGNNSFNIDSSNKIATVSVGSNEEKEYTDSVPDCGKDYYYAIRAVDQFGNVSSVIGDKNIKFITSSTTITTTVTDTTETEAIPVTTNESQVRPDNTDETGSSQESGTKKDTEDNTDIETEQGEVLGVQEQKKLLDKLKSFVVKNKGIAGLIVLFVVVLIYVLIQKIKKAK